MRPSSIVNLGVLRVIRLSTSGDVPVEIPLSDLGNPNFPVQMERTTTRGSTFHHAWVGSLLMLTVLMLLVLTRCYGGVFNKQPKLKKLLVYNFPTKSTEKNPSGVLKFFIAHKANKVLKNIRIRHFITSDCGV